MSDTDTTEDSDSSVELSDDQYEMCDGCMLLGNSMKTVIVNERHFHVCTMCDTLLNTVCDDIAKLLNIANNLAGLR